MGKQACFAFVRVHEPMDVCADPQSTVAIAQDMCGRQGSRHAMERVIYQFLADDLTDAVDSNEDA